MTASKTRTSTAFFTLSLDNLQELIFSTMLMANPIIFCKRQKKGVYHIIRQKESWSVSSRYFWFAPDSVNKKIGIANYQSKRLNMKKWFHEHLHIPVIYSTVIHEMDKWKAQASYIKKIYTIGSIFFIFRFSILKIITNWLIYILY